MTDTRASTQLKTGECIHLLMTRQPRVGRLVFVDAGWPMVFPTSYYANGRLIYFRTAPDSKLLAALDMRQVTFEVDHVDDVGDEGWSVLAFGRLRMLIDEEEVAELRQSPLPQWSRGDRPYDLRLDVATMTGRRFVWAAAARQASQDERDGVPAHVAEHARR
jgi:nitroimidazol reductase NimA-like FMN-containing flavoprotein (pyridoxamine 5'-phosphate oxidase superfamily)